MEFGEFFKIVGIVLLITWIVPSLLCLLFGVLLCACGFGEAGVRVGSNAARWQSAIGNVAKNSLFAVFQSLGATCKVIAGTGHLLVAPIVFLFTPVGLSILAAAATISGLVYYLCYYEGNFSIEDIKNRTSNVNISIDESFEIAKTSISESFENIKTKVSDANITSTISESFENLKKTVSNANITSSVVNSIESVKTSISEANISSKISESFENIRTKVSDANIPSLIDDSFESAKASISDANITASIKNFFGNTFSNANIIISNRNLLCIENLLITCLTLFNLL